LSLTWAVLPDGSAWIWPALVAAPVFNLAGAIGGLLFARGASSRQQLVGRIIAGLSIVALVCHGLMLLALYGLKGALN
jgi:hypothetical protein